MIYVLTRGRIGNQIFMYAHAKAIQKKYGKEEKIIIDDTSVIAQEWEDSLPFYNLENVEFVHSHVELLKPRWILSFFALFIYKVLVHNKDYMKKFNIEKKYQHFFNRMGLIVCENGYLKAERLKKNVLLYGYFQSELYFDSVKDEILNEFCLDKKSLLQEYPGYEDIINRNSVCISIKIQHNVGNGPYDVCTKEYWENAIQYMIDNVENPLFFICSDNVEYVKEHLIDTEKYDVICQSKDFPVQISLAMMSRCKHFIIGNTSFGWWAQYLSKYKDKIVVVPSKWMNVEMPLDIYQKNWIRMK